MYGTSASFLFFVDFLLKNILTKFEAKRKMQK